MCPGHRCEQLSARLRFWEPHCDNLDVFWMLNFKGNKSQLQSHLGSAQAIRQLGFGLREEQRKQRCPKPEQREALPALLDADPTTPVLRCSWLLLQEKAEPFHPLGRSGLSPWADKSLQEGARWERSQLHTEQGWQPVPKALPETFVPSRRL